MKITDEMVEAATRAIHDMDCDTPECTGQLTIEGRYGRWARAALEAARPLVAAQALRTVASTSFVIAEDAPVHACPEPGSGVTACCGRVPFEILGHRMAVDRALVTCHAAPSGGPTGGTPND